MPKTKISEYSATANSNTDVASINIDEGCAPSGINNAIRAIMGHLKDFQSGTSNDPFTVGSSGSLTLSYGTANGVAYLNGSKVLTTGSALTFDGTKFGVGASSPIEKIQSGSGIAATGANLSVGSLDGFVADYGSGVSRLFASRNGVASGSLAFWTTDSTGTAAERMRIDSSGNLGLGVTPSAWGSGYKAFQQFSSVGGFLASGNYAVALGQNTYQNSSGQWIYQGDTYAPSLFNQFNGAFTWYTAPSGTAGNAISFTQAMTLDASGNLGIGLTSLTQRFQVEKSQNGSTWTYITNGNSGSGAAAGVLLGTDQGTSGALSQNSSNAAYGTAANALRLRNLLNAPLLFEINGTIQATIDSSGNLIQSAPTTAPTLSTNGTMVFNLTSNTNLRVSVRGSDGVTRTANLTLA